MRLNNQLSDSLQEFTAFILVCKSTRRTNAQLAMARFSLLGSPVLLEHSARG